MPEGPPLLLSEYPSPMIPYLSLLLALQGPALSQVNASHEHPPTDGLILWLDAGDPATLTLEDGRVAAWTSRAPGADVSLTSAGTQRPHLVATVGRGPAAAVAFDGRDDALRCLDFAKHARTWTLVAVIAPLRPARGAILSACPPGGDDFDPGTTVDLYGATARFDYLSVEGAGRQGGRLNQRTQATPFGAFAVVVVTRDEREIRLHVDGVAEGTRPVTPAETAMGELRLGARHYAGREKEFLKGEIAEVLLYNRALSDTERRTIETPRIVSAAQRKSGEEYGLTMAHQDAKNRMLAPAVIQQWPDEAAYVAARDAGTAPAGPPLPLETLPIRTDLLGAIQLSMRCLNSSFDRDRDGEPFFYSNHRVDGTGEFHHSVNIGIPHVVGRCLLGNMEASLATGLPFPPDGLAILTRYLKSSFDNPDSLNSYFDPERGNARKIEFHNMREGLWGLWAVMHTDEAPWAKETAAKMLRTLDGITDEHGA